jgi:hypothetical protein
MSNLTAKLTTLSIAMIEGSERYGLTTAFNFRITRYSGGPDVDSVRAVNLSLTI